MTILVGNSTQASTGSTNSPAGGQLDAQVFTASASGSTTSGSMYFGTAGITAYMCVYDDSTLALLGQSNAITTVVGWNPVTFSSAMSIASGASYVLAFFTNAANIFGTDGGATYNTKYTNLTSWPTAPATYSSSGTQGDTGNLAIYLSSSSGTAYTLSAATGSFSLIGEGAARDLAIPAFEGSFALTGQAASMARQFSPLASAEGAFSLTGYTANLFWSGAPKARGGYLLLGVG